MMKRYLSCAAVLALLSGCSVVAGSKQQVPPATEISESASYPGHAVYCLDENHDSVDAVLREAERSSGVVLYFHGGLSSRKYMDTELGPWLMYSLFTDANLGNEGNAGILYPIFVNYDAGIMNLDDIANLLKSASVRTIAGKIRKKLEDESNRMGLKSENGEKQYSEAAESILGGRKLKAQADEEKDEIAEYLVDDGELEKKALELASQKDEDLTAAAAELRQLLEATSKEKDLAAESAVSVLRSFKAIVQILARLAIRTNHQIEPTVFEEVARAVGIFTIQLKDLPQAHWKTVYDHAQNCWTGDHNGRYLIDGLVKIREQKREKNEPFAINTLSHSAGSIPTAYLVDYLSNANRMAVDNILMVAPAINQDVFARTIVEKQSSYRKFRSFVLDLEKEKKDNVAIIYRASLLYFVSGLAEEKGHGDRLLLIGQHLDPGRYPYNKPWYRKMFENPQPVWDFFSQQPERVRYYASNFRQDEYHHYDKAETHECTKFPWASQDLAHQILLELGVPDGKFTFPVPKEAEKKCL